MGVSNLGPQGRPSARWCHGEHGQSQAPAGGQREGKDTGAEGAVRAPGQAWPHYAPAGQPD